MDDVQNRPVPEGGGGGRGDYFRLAERGTTASTEIRAGLTTFMVMAYIIFVNPDILSNATEGAGPPFLPTVVATALAAGILTITGDDADNDFDVKLGAARNDVAHRLIVAPGGRLGVGRRFGDVFRRGNGARLRRSLGRCVRDTWSSLRCLPRS